MGSITENDVRSIAPKRFLDKIAFGKVNECWEWKASLTTSGYGKIAISKNGKDTHDGAHRFLYALLNGELKNNVWVLHKCDNRKCVNPNHLFGGTRNDNIQDMISKGRRSSTAGSKNGRSKITESDLPHIREMLKNGNKLVDISAEFKISISRVSAIKNNKNWKHC